MIGSRGKTEILVLLILNSSILTQLNNKDSMKTNTSQASLMNERLVSFNNKNNNEIDSVLNSPSKKNDCSSRFYSSPSPPKRDEIMQLIERSLKTTSSSLSRPALNIMLSSSYRQGDI